VNNDLIALSKTPIQPAFDWDATVAETKELIQEDAVLTATIDDALVKRFHGRVRIGFNLIKLQAEHAKDGYGDFTTIVLPGLGITDRTFAYRCINVAKLFATLDTSSVAQGQQTDFFDLPMPIKTWESLASPSGQTVVKQIESGEISPTQEAIAEALQEAKELKAKNKTLQSQFDFYKQDANQKEALLNTRIDELQQELATLAKPEIREVTPPQVMEHIKKLETELMERTQQRDNLAKEREQLGKELDEQRDANKARREQELYEYRINERVKKICEEWGKTTVQLLGQLPSPIEGQVITANNWALIDHVVDMANRVVAAIRQVKNDRVSILDVEKSNALY